MKKHFIKLCGMMVMLLTLALAMTQSIAADATPEHPAMLSHQPEQDAPTATQVWQPLANKGLNGTVWVISVAGSDLYVGGNFTESADGQVTNLNHIAKYSNGAWSPLSNAGLNGPVSALLVNGGDLYVGGFFDETADGSVTNLGNIAKYSNGTWSALPNGGLTGAVMALAFVGNDLYVGGFFSQTGDRSVTNLGNIAKFSSGAWSALANEGLDGGVFEMAVIGTDLYAGGDFDATGDGIGTNLNNIVIYRNGGWSGVPCSGFVNGSGLDPAASFVNAMAVSGNDLFVGGYFSHTRSCPDAGGENFAYLSAGTWPPISQFGLDDSVTALAVNGNDVYAGGWFVESWLGQVKNLVHIAKFSNGAWSPVPNKGLKGGNFPHVSALKMNGNDLYVGGSFATSADEKVKNLHNIAVLEYCPTKPTAPGVLYPPNNDVIDGRKFVLDWSDVDCAATYNLKVKNMSTGQIIVDKKGLAASKFKIKDLERTNKYWWQVSACNSIGCTKAPKSRFSICPALCP